MTSGAFSAGTESAKAPDVISPSTCIRPTSNAEGRDASARRTATLLPVPGLSRHGNARALLYFGQHQLVVVLVETQDDDTGAAFEREPVLRALQEGQVLRLRIRGRTDASVPELARPRGQRLRISLMFPTLIDVRRLTPGVSTQAS